MPSSGPRSYERSVVLPPARPTKSSAAPRSRSVRGPGGPVRSQSLERSGFPGGPVAIRSDFQVRKFESKLAINFIHKFYRENSPEDAVASGTSLAGTRRKRADKRGPSSGGQKRGLLRGDLSSAGGAPGDTDATLAERLTHAERVRRAGPARASA